MPIGTDTGWLAVNRAQVDQINGALNPDPQVWPYTDKNGSMFIGSDLLTDCMNPGDDYFKAKALLVALNYGTPVFA